MNFDINALKHHQLVEDGQLEGCYIHQPAPGSQQDDQAVLAERQALEKDGGDDEAVARVQKNVERLERMLEAQLIKEKEAR